MVHAKRCLIIITEDNAELRELLAKYLGERYHCLTAATAEDAVKLLVSSPFNFILTDILLPGASGLELCKIVRATHPETSVILMSASPDLRFEVEAARLRAFDYLRKPFSLSQLDNTLEHSLRHQALYSELRSITSSAG